MTGFLTIWPGVAFRSCRCGALREGCRRGRSGLCAISRVSVWSRRPLLSRFWLLPICVSVVCSLAIPGGDCCLRMVDRERMRGCGPLRKQSMWVSPTARRGGVGCFRQWLPGVSLASLRFQGRACALIGGEDFLLVCRRGNSDRC